ncbi:hypothetical protein DLAC_03596 [Tieghemostelium lacteum]|uniref:CBM20 domain-containing protein n=1 Tax=Tieghemostelium lacteum TaxID=361077 RepID=A0A152A0C5_TIELA|nr:hypothetical protein DLAC_03596 [Tieghemostelium lacteum]|eukprot:KYQ99658.1 hypothetical protein DLAC_03596 [Tieghemostelium lacteum]
MFRASSSSLLCGNNVTFTICYNTQPGENVYIVGNHPQIGEWQFSRAKRMTWNNGNIWDINIGFPNDVLVQYKYFVHNEYTSSSRWENIENREILVDNDDMIFEDSWETRRAIAPIAPNTTTTTTFNVVISKQMHDQQQLPLEPQQQHHGIKSEKGLLAFDRSDNDTQPHKFLSPDTPTLTSSNPKRLSGQLE